MATGVTVFSTYQFTGSSYSASAGYGHSTPLHCGYIQTSTTDTLDGKSINMYFPTVTEFAFLTDPTTAPSSTGFTATGFRALIQVVSGITDSGTTITPDPAGWFVVDLTDQILNHTVGDAINAFDLASTTFTIDPLELTVNYTLSYLNYPTNLSIDDDRLAFGEEVFFYGNIKTDIKATAYTSDIPIVLPLNEFNSTTNPTWDGASSVYVSEVGIYNSNGELVAIGKLNNPIEKNSSISRTILFAMDF